MKRTPRDLEEGEHVPGQLTLDDPDGPPPPDPDGRITVHHGDCLDVMATLPDNSVDAVVTDPPYGLGFMGKEWDDLPPGEPWAAECLRVLKPGGHLLAFGGTRTWHRLAVAVEDAGFEIRDSIAWLYGSGFPKSLDVSKAIDKAARGAMVRGKLLHFAAERGIDGAWLEAHGVASSSSFADWTTGGHVPSDRNWQLVKTALGVTSDEEAAYEREIIGARTTGIGTGRGSVAYIADSENRDITAPATPAAQQWQGWGTALKPAFEPVVVARKPLAGTVAANVLAHGTGALNIDGTRVPHGGNIASAGSAGSGSGVGTDGTRTYGVGVGGVVAAPHDAGRWPANVLLDGDTADTLDQQGPHTRDGVAVKRNGVTSNGVTGWGAAPEGTPDAGGYGGSGGPSRFFPVFRYEAKAPARERPHVDGVGHVTVKPLTLMRWLVRLVTPPGGLLLDPFAGSGTTGEAALREGMRAVLIERDEGYLPLIDARIAAVRRGVHRRRPPAGGEPAALTLWGDDDEDGA